MNNTDGKIYIYITDKEPQTSGNVGSSGSVEKKNKKADEELFSHWANERLINTTRNIASTCVNYSLSNIGNFTGDYITQQNINDTLSNLSAINSIGLGVLAGAKYGPAGALIGERLGLINTGVSSALNMHTMRVANNKMNFEISRLRDRAGLNALSDGSRGTEN